MPQKLIYFFHFLFMSIVHLLLIFHCENCKSLVVCLFCLGLTWPCLFCVVCCSFKDTYNQILRYNVEKKCYHFFLFFIFFLQTNYHPLLKHMLSNNEKKQSFNFILPCLPPSLVLYTSVSLVLCILSCLESHQK